MNASTHTIVPVARSDALAIAQVDLDAIAANVSWFVTRARGASLMAVVKGDAFGHGAVQVANAALRAGATWLGVARIEEALALREAGISAPILAWILDPAWIAAAVDRSVDLSASSIADLYCIAAAASVSTPPGAIPQVHLKLDTGLHRAGVPSGDWASAVGLAARLETAGHLRVRGVWSHLSHGDVWDHPANEVQAARLAAGIRVTRRAGLRPDVTHLANSGGVDQLGAMGCSLVRVGAGLYGIDVFDGAAGSSSLRPALTLSARIIGVRTLASGEGVAYGHEWVTARSTRLALVPVGYADGLPRNGGNLARFLAGGQLVPLAGRVSMDQVTIDVTGVEAGVGDAVTIIGDGTDGAPTTMDWARWTGTIPHEVLTGIGPRIPRVARGRTA